MYLFYFDESGDSGMVNSPTRFFVLSCVVVHQDDWLKTLDNLIHMRRLIKNRHNISTRPEIKATDIRRGRGPLVPLRWSLERRMEFYRNLMKYQCSYLTNIYCFSIAINKEASAKKKTNPSEFDPRQEAWMFALQRVERFCKDKQEKAMIFPDEGNGVLVKRLTRAMRRHHNVPRHWGEGAFKVPVERLIEDPNDRKSHDSYFIQLADWNAYASHRSSYVDGIDKVPGDLWDDLGDRRLLAVNSVTGGPPGIVVYPT